MQMSEMSQPSTAAPTLKPGSSSLQYIFCFHPELELKVGKDEKYCLHNFKDEKYCLDSCSVFSALDCSSAHMATRS